MTLSVPVKAAVNDNIVILSGMIEGGTSPASARTAAASLGSVLRQCGDTRTLRRAHRGDRDVKRMLYQDAFSMHDGSRACYDRKRREGQHHVRLSSPSHASEPAGYVGF